MNFQNIETFLTIVQEGGISQAAEKMYTTQSNVSKQLKKLETELGVTLINRDKGVHSAYLTVDGEQFLPIAQEYYYAHLRLLRFQENQNRTTLKVASIDSLNASVLYEIYPKLIQRLPNLILTVTTNQSDIIYDMVNRQLYDVGFVLMESRWPNIIVKPFITQEFRLIMYSASGNLPQKISLRELEPKKEIFQPFGARFQAWHEYWWPNHQYRIQTEYDISGTKMLFTEGFWTIVPETVAKRYLQTPSFHQIETEEPLPVRETFYITNKNPASSCKDSLQVFETMLEQYKKGEFDNELET